ncbi:hypothetical protein GpartN1_g5200.t1 [Galdieria partita]|uniref:DUF5107 domain-containing protein n=1 Tax=Galdieria partita TaxID=83374 RepID=A0A9C7PZH0_9RHOD|nr:hypothetical protein GpartN1_g5200.t1 [Galdieria partita]
MAQVWEETVYIPSYEVGKPEKNPLFLEKRVYQGSSGKVYPYPVIEKIYDQKLEKPYRIVFLENEYIQVQLMPDIGGRVYRYLDKTNDYDAVYYNRVIKPALVGLAGPWISGGIEFNWPQHHRPNTFGKVEYYYTRDKESGACTCWMTEVDRMYGTKCSVAFSIYPGKSFLEIKVMLYNRTVLPQTFLWWANPAVHVHDQTQSIFPPDVRAVFDHGKRDLSRFPIATGVYYKVDYSEGVDISWYKNVPVPTSYMAYYSKYDFLGGYDHHQQAGILHIADHHISPGKKQWTWGCGNFGDVWHQQLTDEDGPYVELMAGVYTDNQPDFTWLKPQELKTFTQYFLPYKQVGVVKNANIDFAIGMDVKQSQVQMCVYSSSTFEQLKLLLTDTRNNSIIYEDFINVSPQKPFTHSVTYSSNVYHQKPHDLKMALYGGKDNSIEFISYQPEYLCLEKFPEPAKPIEAPELLPNTESLFLAGLHLEQYRHATYRPEDYYLEGLKRDKDDIRLNNAYGLLLLRHGDYKAAKEYFERAIVTSTRHNPNPYDCSAYYYLGLCLKYEKRWEEAFDSFYKSVWDSHYHSLGYYQLACLSFQKRNYSKSLEFIETSLKKDRTNLLVLNARITILRKLGCFAEASECCDEVLKDNPLEAAALLEKSLLEATDKEKTDHNSVVKDQSSWLKILDEEPHQYLALTEEYWELGDYDTAIWILEQVINQCTIKGVELPFIVYYAMAFVQQYMQHSKSSSYSIYFEKASKAGLQLYFSTSLFEMFILEDACKQTLDYKPYYMLGNLLYDKRRYQEAIFYWQKCIELEPSFPTAYRNLSLAYFNKLKDSKKSKEYMERAFSLDTSDARVFYELDKLHRILGIHPKQRLEQLELHASLVQQRDDLIVEHVTLLNRDGAYDKALSILLNHRFHPWEGGEGKVIAQYTFSCIELAKKHLFQNETDKAISYLIQAMEYPLNLGEGKLQGTRENHIFYLLGCCYEQRNDKSLAIQYYEQASQGSLHLEPAMFYNDQPPELIFYQGLAFRRLRDEKNAKRCFHTLKDYGEVQLFKDLKIDYFAVSLPNMLVFEEDLNRMNQIQSRFLLALGYIGLYEYENAQQQLELVIELDPCHLGAFVHLEMLKKPHRSLLIE